MPLGFFPPLILALDGQARENQHQLKNYAMFGIRAFSNEKIVD